MRGTIARIVIEAGITAAIAFALSLIVFGPLLGQLDVGWAGGDMLSTYVNSVAWSGFTYAGTTQFGFPLGMYLAYFPGIDITQNTFAMVVNAIAGTTFLGINLLVVVSFPLVAALAYLCIRMTGLNGPLAIALAVAFTFIPFHWGRALGHTYLATLYSAVIGMALVLLVISGRFEQLLRARSRRRWAFLAVLALMVVTVAWSGVYYAAFTLILGAAALVWRFAQHIAWRTLLLEASPFAAITVLSLVGFVPSLLTVRGDPALASLGERLPYESVIFAGNLAMALIPLPQSSLPGADFYNRSVLEAIQAAPFGESTVITNHGTWITSLALVVLLGALILRQRRPLAQAVGDVRVTLGQVGYLIVVVLLFFVPWGLNYLLAGTVTAQIRAWNRLLPFLLLLFILGAAVALRRTRIADRMAFALPVALIVFGLVAVDSVYPFRAAYAGSVAEGGEVTDAARIYAADVNDTIPEDCGVLQLPYMAYPEHGLARGINDYDHFWTSITNEGKQWSYGSVKYTDASVWASQLPQVPTDEQLALLRGAGFCAIHLDTLGYVSEGLPDLTGHLETRLGAPVAKGFDGRWLMYSMEGVAPAPDADVTAFLRQPMITADDTTTGPRQARLDSTWWWTTAAESTFALQPTGPQGPLTRVTGAIEAPSCGPLPVRVTLTAAGSTVSADVLAAPEAPGEFVLELPSPTLEAGQLTVSAPGQGCEVDGQEEPVFVKVLDLKAR